jgi:hypothetical protein
MFFHKRLQTFTKLSLRSHTGATRALVPLTTGGGTRPAVLPPGRPAPYHQGPLLFPPGDPHVHTSAGPAGRSDASPRTEPRLGRQAGEWPFRASAHRPYIDGARTVATKFSRQGLPNFRLFEVYRIETSSEISKVTWPKCGQRTLYSSKYAGASLFLIARYERQRRTKDSRVLLAGPMRPRPPEGCEATTGRISLLLQTKAPLPSPLWLPH